MRNAFLILMPLSLGCVQPAIDQAKVDSIRAALMETRESVAALSSVVEDHSADLQTIKEAIEPEEPEPETVERLPVSTPPVADPVSDSDLYVVEWTQPGCPPCIRWEMTEKPQLTMAVRTIDIQREPALARQHGVSVTPTIQLCSRSTRKVRARWNKYTTAATIKAKARELKRGKRTVSRVMSRKYQPVNYSSHWSIGTARNPRQATASEIVSHLQSSHGQFVAGMSVEQMLQLHDSLHQQGM